MHSNIIAYVPNAAIKDILTYPDSEGNRGKWFANVMEYDVEIRPTKFVKGHGLEKLLVDSNSEALGLHLMAEHSIQEELQTWQDKEQIMDKYVESEWYPNFLFHL